jgi:antitoxin component YwqK of YwqJK toxin-antitoxin module
MKGLSGYQKFVLFMFTLQGLYLIIVEGWSLPSDEGFYLILFGVGIILHFINSSILKVESTLLEKISIDNEKVKDGPFEEFYPNGSLKLEGEYKNGKKEGDWKEYFENGVLKESRQFWEGKKTGISVIYQESGEKTQILFHFGGVLKESHQLKNDLLHGDKKYFKGGILIGSSTYENGKIINGQWDSYNEELKLYEEGNYLNGKKDGLWEFYLNPPLSRTKNETPIEKGKYLNGNKEGKWEFFHKNGQLKEKGNYLNGEEEGVWEYFDEKGSFQYTKKFENGQET